MADLIPINIVIGDRTYRIKTNAQDEEAIRSTLKIINEKINKTKDKIIEVENKKDLKSELNEVELVELPAHRVFQELGYQTLEGTDVNSERNSYNDVILVPRLDKKIRELNPNLPDIV